MGRGNYSTSIHQPNRLSRSKADGQTDGQDSFSMNDRLGVPDNNQAIIRRKFSSASELLYGARHSGVIRPVPLFYEGIEIFAKRLLANFTEIGFLTQAEAMSATFDLSDKNKEVAHVIMDFKVKDGTSRGTALRVIAILEKGLRGVGIYHMEDQPSNYWNELTFLNKKRLNKIDDSIALALGSVLNNSDGLHLDFIEIVATFDEIKKMRELEQKVDFSGAGWYSPHNVEGTFNVASNLIISHQANSASGYNKNICQELLTKMKNDLINHPTHESALDIFMDHNLASMILKDKKPTIRLSDLETSPLRSPPRQ